MLFVSTTIAQYRRLRVYGKQGAQLLRGNNWSKYRSACEDFVQLFVEGLKRQYYYRVCLLTLLDDHPGEIH